MSRERVKVGSYIAEGIGSGIYFVEQASKRMPGYALLERSRGKDEITREAKRNFKGVETLLKLPEKPEVEKMDSKEKRFTGTITDIDGEEAAFFVGVNGAGAKVIDQLSQEQDVKPLYNANPSRAAIRIGDAVFLLSNNSGRVVRQSGGENFPVTSQDVERLKRIYQAVYEVNREKVTSRATHLLANLANNIVASYQHAPWNVKEGEEFYREFRAEEEGKKYTYGLSVAPNATPTAGNNFEFMVVQKEYGIVQNVTSVVATIGDNPTALKLEDVTKWKQEGDRYEFGSPEGRRLDNFTEDDLTVFDWVNTKLPQLTMSAIVSGSYRVEQEDMRELEEEQQDELQANSRAILNRLLRNYTNFGGENRSGLLMEFDAWDTVNTVYIPPGFQSARDSLAIAIEYIRNGVIENTIIIRAKGKDLVQSPRNNTRSANTVTVEKFQPDSQKEVANYDRIKFEEDDIYLLIEVEKRIKNMANPNVLQAMRNNNRLRNVFENRYSVVLDNSAERA